MHLLLVEQEDCAPLSTPDTRNVLEMTADDGAPRRSCLAQAGVGESSLVLLMMALSLIASSRSSGSPLVPAGSPFV